MSKSSFAGLLGLLAGLVLIASAAAQSPRIVLEQPVGGLTTAAETTIQGRVVGLKARELLLLHNGLERRVRLSGGRFRLRVALFAGLNRFRLTARQGAAIAQRQLTLTARLRGQAMVARLTWGPRADLDLIVREPDGGLVFFASPRSAFSSFHGEVRRGQGPEIYRSRRLQRGTYQLIVRNWSTPDQVPVRATLSVSWKRGGRTYHRSWPLTLSGTGMQTRRITIRD